MKYLQFSLYYNINYTIQAELQQKLEAALSSKQKYKTQWGLAVRQNSQLQQKIHLMERLEMTKKEEEIASVQQHALAIDEKNTNHTKDEVLEIVKENVEK